MSEGNVSLADGGFTTPSGAEVFLFHEVALGQGGFEAGLGARYPR